MLVSHDITPNSYVVCLKIWFGGADFSKGIEEGDTNDEVIFSLAKGESFIESLDSALPSNRQKWRELEQHNWNNKRVVEGSLDSLWEVYRLGLSLRPKDNKTIANVMLDERRHRQGQILAPLFRVEL